MSIIRLIDSADIKRIYYSLFDQLLRSSTSVGANVVEARASHSNKYFIKYYEIALKSANECKYWLCKLRDGLKLNVETLNELIDEANQISKIIASIIVKVKQQK
ncbi:MAG: four helix bundle protein [Bacteroidetes bacterium]|nr:four helix bundle protein [Bacteroidota bacterium]